MKFINSFVFAGLVAVTAQAQAADVYLQKTDFVSAHVAEKGSTHVVQGKLKPEAVARLNALSQKETSVDIRIGEAHQVLKLKDKIAGDRIEFGPFNNAKAQKVSAEINRK